MPPFSLCPPKYLRALAPLGLSISSDDSSTLMLAQEAVQPRYAAGCPRKPAIEGKKPCTPTPGDRVLHTANRGCFHGAAP